MSSVPDLDLDGPAAPPRSNGELVFAEPWEARVFGVTLALCRAGRLDYARFREHLIAVVAEWDRDPPPDQPYRYYERWLAALERALDEGGLCPREPLARRVRELAARPQGHDHQHEHGGSR